MPGQQEATRELVHELERAIGAEQVRFDHMSRLLYSTDASNYQIMPVGVTVPRDADEVVAIHELARKYQTPLLPRGGGSSLAGQTVGRAIVMDFSKWMRRVRAVNADEASVIVEPGLVLGQLNQQLGELGLMFGPDPASAERATLGGCIGNNATGAHSILYGMTADHVQRLEVVLASGERTWLDADRASLRALRARIAGLAREQEAEMRARWPQTFRTVAGYALNKIDPAAVDLRWLFAGSEGTLGTIVAAELNLVPTPALRRLALVHFEELRAALEAVPGLLELKPSAIEMLDRALMERTRASAEFAPKLAEFIEGDPAAVQVVEFYGESEVELDSHINGLRRMLRRSGHRGALTLAHTPAQQQQVWSVRKAGLGLLMSERRPDKAIPFVEDAAVPIERLSDYISDIEHIVREAGTTCSIYAHASAGCLHVRPLVNLKSEAGRRQYRFIAEAATDAAVKYKGTISGEHGTGLVRAEFNRKLFGASLMSAFREVKRAFDPDNLMNPGKIVDFSAMDDASTLRLAPALVMQEPRTRFDWSADGGLAGAVEMCNGAGVCRKEDVGTMCPSYMATRDEEHTTRGRANALRLAMSGHLQPEGLGSDALHEVFELCLSCKACKAECPSAVDMARIKSETMALRHDLRGVPLKTRLFANIHRLNALGSLWPAMANLALRSKAGLALARQIGLPVERPLPAISPRRLSQMVGCAGGEADATLIVDTFTEFNHPAPGLALLRVAGALGLRLRVQRLPGQGCCGRPAISNGMLDLAKTLATENVRQLDPAQGPYLFLEPSCQSAFIDDLPGLAAPELQERATALAQQCVSAESWLTQQLAGRELAWDGHQREILLHGHCHQKALWGTADSLGLLRSIPETRVREIDSGCCGVAGSFGYEHYTLSLKIGEQRLLPTLREHPAALVAAPGSSCRTQIHEAGFRVWHPVELVAAALAG